MSQSNGTVDLARTLKNGDFVFAEEAFWCGESTSNVLCRIAYQHSVQPAAFSADLSSGHPVIVPADKIRRLSPQEASEAVSAFAAAMRE